MASLVKFGEEHVIMLPHKLAALQPAVSCTAALAAARSHPQPSTPLGIYGCKPLTPYSLLPLPCSELHQLLQLATLLDEHSTAVSSLDLSLELWHNTQVAELLSSLIAQHGAKLAGLGVDFRACAADLSGGLRAGSIEAAAAAEEMLAEALQQAAAEAAQGEACFFAGN